MPSSPSNLDTTATTARPDLIPAKRRWVSEALGTAGAWLSVIAIIAVCAFILGYLLKMGWQAISPEFFLNDPSSAIAEGDTSGGIRAPLVGSLALILISTVLVVPISLAAAIYLAEYMDERSPVTRVVRMGLEVLAGVPSVVFGMFGLAMFSAPTLAFLSSKGDGAEIEAAFGRSFIIAGIVMTIHIMPFVIKVMEEAIRSVPSTYREGAQGLGFTKWRTIRRVILPAARPGLVTATILGMGLVAGDTAIVWLTLGGSITITGADQWWLPWNWIAVARGTGATLTTFTYFASPAGDGNAPEKAYGAAFVLMCIVLLLNAAVAWFGRPASHERAR